MITSPMLAGKSEGKNLATLQFPVLATPKLDGIRCLMIGGKAVSRKFKPIPNNHIRQTLEMTCNSMQLDGEIMVEGRNFNDLSGDVRRTDGRPDFYYAVFDHVGRISELEPEPLRTCYKVRMKMLASLRLPPCCRKILPQLIGTHEALLEYEQEQIELGYEGIMVRAPNGPYKCGRSTWNEGYLIKVKRFEDDEATIIDFEEEMHNTNPAEDDELGHTKRSSAKAGLVGKGTLGKFICLSPKWPEEFGVGTGFTALQRQEFWYNRPQLKGKLIKFKHQISGSSGERPRIPVFLGFRDEWDL